MKIGFYTLGCRLNQSESESIAAAFKAAGFDADEADNESELTIISTCTVTSKAEQKARRVIRALLKENPRRCLIVTGCYAQLNKADILALDESTAHGCRLFVIQGDDKSVLLDFPQRLKARLAESDGAALPVLIAEIIAHNDMPRPAAEDAKGGKFRFNAGGFLFHSRSFLKIQDGCDNACTYCRVRAARGKSVCIDSSTALTRLTELEKAGFCEAVLSGVNVSQYKDVNAGLHDLSALLQFLLAGTHTISLRLSSLESECFNDNFFAMVKNERIRPYFHLSIQSGSETVLRRMGRSYTPEFILETIKHFRDVREDPFLACDMITGFPGESEDDFEKTLSLCQEADFAWIHAFPYSPRPGTAAWQFKDHVSEYLAKSRVEKLLELGKQGKDRYKKRFLNKEVRAVSLGYDEKKGGITALSENYLRLFIKGDAAALPQKRQEFRCTVNLSNLL